MLREIETLRAHLTANKINIDAKVIQSAIMMKRDVETKDPDALPRVVESLMQTQV